MTLTFSLPVFSLWQMALIGIVLSYMVVGLVLNLIRRRHKKAEWELLWAMWPVVVVIYTIWFVSWVISFGAISFPEAPWE